MELKKLTIRNFLGIGEGEITFDQSGVVLIEGLNHDSPSSISNGAGKSSIFEALFWVLFGKTKRGLTGDDVVNNVGGKNCRVELEFDDYLVVRTRKDHELGAALLFKQRTGDGEAKWKDLTLGTVRDTQKLIEDAIKVSELTFSKVAYFGQGDIKGFAGLSDSDLKKVFEQALGLSFFAEYRDKVKEYRAGLEGELKELELGHSRALRDAAHVREKMDLLQRSLDEYYDRLESDRQRLGEELAAIGTELDLIDDSFSSSLQEIEKELQTLALHEDKQRILQERYSHIEEHCKNLERKLTRNQAENSALASRVRDLEDDVIAVEAKRGLPCEMCGKIYEAEDLEVARKNLLSKLNEDNAVYETGIEEALEIESRFKESMAVLAEMKLELAAFDHVLPRLVELKTRREELKKAAARRRTNLFTKKEEIVRRMVQLDEGQPRSVGMLEAARHDLARLDEMARQLSIQMEELSREVKIAGLLEDVLGNGGMKSYVFDAVTPQLNKLIDRNIKVLDDIDIEVSTVSKLKSGEYRERFSIGVRNHHGADVFEGNSGGEIQKINLAISLAINSLVRTIAEGSINAIFLDECFENLDEGSSERVLDLIGAIETPNVFVITQRSDVKELIGNVIRVEKRGGRATIR
jgi:DNA repair exonuclease SbcCD ATPase subunit